MELLDVYQLACRLHTGQVDKTGRPYIEHLTRVLLRVHAAGGDLFQQMAALLHDVIEDRKASAEQLLWLGVPAEVVEMVKLGDLDDKSDSARLAMLPEALARRLKKKYDSAKLFLAAA